MSFTPPRRRCLQHTVSPIMHQAAAVYRSISISNVVNAVVATISPLSTKGNDDDEAKRRETDGQLISEPVRRKPDSAPCKLQCAYIPVRAFQKNVTKLF